MMRLTRRIILQLCIFGVIAITGAAVLLVGYADLPARLFGADRYRVTVELPESAGLYPNGNVTYRGTEVGRIDDVHLTEHGVEVRLSLDSDIPVPADVDAQVHSVSPVGEQYIALQPRTDTTTPLRDGAVITADRTTIPVPIDRILDNTNRGIQAIPRDNLKTAVDEAYTAVGGLGPELTRIVDGANTLANDAATNQQALTDLIDQTPPLLDSQTDTADSITAWAAHLASITAQLRDTDPAVGQLLDDAGPAADQARALIERVQPTLPVLLANLVTVGQVGITYQPNLEQILVLLPQAIAQGQSVFVANQYNPGPANAAGSLNLALNLNLPPPCTTGYLPAQQRRAPAIVDSPPRPAGDLYCRIPQDSPFGVRGARNIPCETKPWKRAPTVAMCESDQDYVPLNDGDSWKGDPNATQSGQDVPQLPPGSSAPPTAPPPIAVAQYDPATGTYFGPDGQQYTQADLAHDGGQQKTWQSLLTPAP
jgi:phospholipid/cholesterol/gamma-HCH transport system substrate-binding protein